MRSGLYLAGLQVLAQAAALGLWLLLGATTASASQSTAITAYGIGAVIALPLTLGIPFTLPNLYRGASSPLRGAAGPWTAPTRFAGTVCALASCIAVLIAICGLFWPALTDASATIATAGATGAAILVVQLARIRRNTVLMLTGLAMYPLAPLIWLITLHNTDGRTQTSTLIFGSVMVLATLTALQRSSALPPARSVSTCAREASSTIRTSAPLIPHLLCFSGLMQGIRLGVLIAGVDLLVVPGHLVMLIIGAVTSVVTSVNAVLAVGIQAADDSSLRAKARRNAQAYGALSVFAATSTAAGLLLAPIAVTSFPHLSVSDLLLAAAAATACCFYYSLSAFALRDNRTGLLASTTVLCFLGSSAVYIFVAPASLSSALLIYSSTMMALPLILSLALVVRSRSIIRRCATVVVFQAILALPLFTAGVVSAGW